ncbi:hypothetical protein L9F63_024324, partial [Diploptera punctata]
LLVYSSNLKPHVYSIFFYSFLVILSHSFIPVILSYSNFKPLVYSIILSYSFIPVILSLSFIQ